MEDNESEEGGGRNSARPEEEAWVGSKRPRRTHISLCPWRRKERSRDNCPTVHEMTRQLQYLSDSITWTANRAPEDGRTYDTMGKQLEAKMRLCFFGIRLFCSKVEIT